MHCPEDSIVTFDNLGLAQLVVGIQLLAHFDSELGVLDGPILSNVLVRDILLEISKNYLQVAMLKHLRFLQMDLHSSLVLLQMDFEFQQEPRFITNLTLD